MKTKILILIIFILNCGLSFGQSTQFDKINFIIGQWSGTGSGFGNDSSTIESSFELVMDGKYIEVQNDSRFEPTEKNPEGEHHIDKGFISYDKRRQLIVYRQFNNEGYINQYVLNDSLSNGTKLVFESEIIENFVPGGKARWTIEKKSDTQIETTFDVSFPNKDYTCLGVNKLTKK
ncbi:hypothetical protein [Salinimicrobium soli]|uniref:hypothetical protein n=1 Tax=Salinimicrobium soli TaxID=1254399 RepID=UPI003AAD16DC